MSAVSESMNRRMTLGLLASRYGFDLDPTFATEVTITSIADDIDSVVHAVRTGGCATVASGSDAWRIWCGGASLVAW